MFTKADRVRFWRRVDFNGPVPEHAPELGRCWIAPGAEGFKDGYARFQKTIGGKRHRLVAHRVAWLLTKGTIDHGKTIDHRCRNRACCRPAHGEEVTQSVNTLRSTGVSATNARKTACPRGHAYADHGKLRPNGWRRCACCEQVFSRERKRRFRKRHRVIHGR